MKNLFPSLLLCFLSLQGAAQTPLATHDPVMARGEDGRYYLFSTGMGIQVMSSADLREWRFEPSVFAEAPQWARDSIPGFRSHTWAPDICRRDSLWHLYYSCSAFGKNTSAIGLAVNRTLDPSSPLFRWEDRGPVVLSHPRRDNWNAIDANLITDTQGQPFLTYGSFWDGIQLLPLGPADLQTPLEEPHTIARRWNHRYRLDANGYTERHEVRNGDTIAVPENAIEAPFIVRRGHYYYLFVSHDYCCRGEQSTYRTVYGRSRHIQGPYVDEDGRRMDEGGGTLLFGPTPRYAGIGHCSVYEFNGQWLFVAHAYDRASEGHPRLFIRPLTFTRKGWIKPPRDEPGE